jgi:hypothetical protein
VAQAARLLSGWMRVRGVGAAILPPWVAQVPPLHSGTIYFFCRGTRRARRLRINPALGYNPTMDSGGETGHELPAAAEPNVLDQWFARQRYKWWTQNQRLLLLIIPVACSVFLLESLADLRVAFAGYFEQTGLSSLANSFDNFYSAASWWSNAAFFPICVAAVMLFRPLFQSCLLPPDFQLAFSKSDYYGRLRRSLTAAAYLLVLFVYVPFLLPEPVSVALYRINLTTVGFLLLQMFMAAALAAVCAELLVWSVLKRRLVQCYLVEVLVIGLLTIKFVGFHVAWQLDSVNAPDVVSSFIGFDVFLSALGAPLLPFIAYGLRKATAAMDVRFEEYLTESIPDSG